VVLRVVVGPVVRETVSVCVIVAVRKSTTVKFSVTVVVMLVKSVVVNTVTVPSTPVAVENKGTFVGTVTVTVTC
jgi:hypothetical protein